MMLNSSIFKQRGQALQRFLGDERPCFRTTDVTFNIPARVQDDSKTVDGVVTRNQAWQFNIMHLQQKNGTLAKSTMTETENS